MRLSNPIGSNSGEIPRLATRRQENKPLTQQQFTSPDDLVKAAVLEVFSNDDDEDADDIFYVDDVI